MTPDDRGIDPDRHGGEPRRGWLALVACLLTALLGRAALSGELVYDDLWVIGQNPRLAELSNWPSAFGATYWAFLEPEVAERIGYWRPLATLAYMLVFAASGPAAYAYHVLSVAVHVLAVAAVFLLGRRVLRSDLAAFGAALLFGLHPSNVESWAWISALNGVLAGLFALLALWAHQRYRDRGSPGWSLAAPLLFVPSLLSKELAVATVAMAVALDLTRPREGSALRRALLPFSRAYAPWAAVIGLYYLGRVLVFGNAWAGMDRAPGDLGADVDWVRLAWLRIELLGGGLLQCFVPDPAVFRPIRPVVRVGDGELLASLGVVVAVAAIVAVGLRRRRGPEPALLLLAALSLGPLLLRVGALGLFPLSDRFLYVATAGCALFVSALAHRFLPRVVATIALVGLAAVAFRASDQRAEVWLDEQRLFAAATSEAPNSPYAFWGSGRVELDLFRASGDAEHLEAAREAFDEGARLLRDAAAGDTTVFATQNDLLQVNLGLAWCHLLAAEIDPERDFVTPKALFGVLTDTDPESHEAWTGLGVARQAGGDVDGAIDALEKALELHPAYAPAHYNLAVVTTRRGEWERARKHAEAALAQRPESPKDLVLLARILFEGGERDAAEAAARRAHENDESSADPLVVLAIIAGSRGDASTALRYLDQALALDPDDPRAHAAKGKELARLGRNEDAITALRRACDLAPRDFEAHYNLGALLLASGAKDSARDYLMRAYLLCTDFALRRALRTTLLDIGGDDPALARAVAALEARRGDHRSAVEWYDDALRLDDESGRTWLERGISLLQLEHAEEALVSIRRAAELLPDSFSVQVRLGEALDALERADEAQPHWVRAREIGPPENMPEDLRAIVVERIEKRLAEG